MGLLYLLGDDQIRPRMKVPWSWPVTAVHDYGIDTGAWVWIARVCGEHSPMKDGDLLVVDELNAAGMSVDVQVSLQDQRRRELRVVQSIIDPHANTRTHAGDRYIRLSDLFRERGVYFAPGSSDRTAGVMAIATALKERRLWVMENCRGVVNDLKTARLENLGAKHFESCMRYGLLASPERKGALLTDEKPPEGFMVKTLTERIDTMMGARRRVPLVRGGGRK